MFSPVLARVTVRQTFEAQGLHQFVFEVASRAVNEVLAGRASRVDVTFMPDGGVRVADDGPGVPFEDAGMLVVSAWKPC
jgi:DNA gyrase/topoisomerase IV subunit B